MSKRPSLFSNKPAPAVREAEEPPAEAALEAPQTAPLAAVPSKTQRYPKASTREGKRVVTAYVSPEAFRQLKRIAADEDMQQQDLLLEGINAVFEKRGLSRIA